MSLFVHQMSAQILISKFVVPRRRKMIVLQQKHVSLLMFAQKQMTRYVKDVLTTHAKFPKQEFCVNV